MSGDGMRRYWDERAREDPFYFVDNRLAYGDPDLDRFWRGGPEALVLMEEQLGVRVDEGDEVVEIGCGVGRMTRALAERARYVRAFDVSAEMVKRAVELNGHLENVQFLVGDGVSLEGVDDASADVCHSDVVFQHIPDPEITFGYVREMGRVLRPGGIAMFQISNVPEEHRPRSLAHRLRAELRARLGRGPAGQSHEAWLGSGVDLGELAAAADEGGLDVERTTGERTMSCRVLLRRRAEPA